ncbi:MAG: polysaccharide pyruvyl transferase family protein [Coriobacteriia bacterium]|nr:polysaccharide pyruvyl transferase family protein [Coriobacteriia bacterium]MBN2840215.1 polysaccharide pyruvyl transferase family protein [Coriobacteriia bacterium]
MPHDPRTILIIRAYSPANIGDGAIALAMQTEARRVFGVDTRVVFGATDPDSFESLLGLEANHHPIQWGRMGSMHRRLAWLVRTAPLLLRVWHATGGDRSRFERAVTSRRLSTDAVEALAPYLEADLVLACGGGYLGDEYRRQYPAIQLEYRAARAAGVPLVFFSQSFGPAEWPLSRFLLRRALRIASVFIARDEPSARRVRGLGIPEEKLRVCPDVAVLTVPHVGVDPRPGLLGLALLGRGAYPGGDGAVHDAYTEAMFRVAKAHLERDPANHVRLYSASKAIGPNTMDDVSTAERMRERLWAAGYVDRCSCAEWTHDPERFSTDIAACELLVTSRAHAGVLALAQGVPVVGVASQEKVGGLLEHFGSGAWVLRIDEPEKLVEMVERAWAQRQDLRKTVRLALPGVLRDAGRAMEICAGALQNDSSHRPGGGSGTLRASDGAGTSLRR